MKTSFISLLLVTGCTTWTGCSSEPTGDPADDEAPFAYRKGVAAEVRAPETAVENKTTDDLAIDWTGVPAFVAQNEAQGALALTSVGALLTAFAVNRATLDPAKAPRDIAAAIAAEVKATLCVDGSVSHKAGDAHLGVTFGPSCTLPGSKMAALGTIAMGITTGVSGKAWAAADLTFTGISVDGYPLDGYATVSSDGTTDTFSTRMTVGDLGTIVFRGTATAVGADVTVDGAGGWTGTEYTTPAADGWTCISSPASALRIRSVERTSMACYAEGGRLEVTTPYACRHENSVGGSATARRSLLSTTSMTFLPTTPSTRAVTGTVSVPGGSSDPHGTTMTTKLTDRSCK